MITQPLISVIMSAYNAEKYIQEAVESILQQTYKNIELIIFDDCSQDKTAEILFFLAQKDARIKIITRNENHGLKGFIKNLNDGIEIANGKYIARMDADDYSMPDRFEKQVHFLESHPEISMIGAQINLIDEKNEFIKEKKGALTHEEIVKRIPLQIQLFHPVIMFRNHENIKYREKFLYCEDYDLYLNLITQGKKLANLKDTLLKYRVLNQSISRKDSTFVKKLMVEKALDFYNQRCKTGNDAYETFNPDEILEIMNKGFKNKPEVLFFAMKTAIKLNNKEHLIFLIDKCRNQYPNLKIPLVFNLYSISPIIVFRFLKKIIR